MRSLVSDGYQASRILGANKLNYSNEKGLPEAKNEFRGLVHLRPGTRGRGRQKIKKEPKLLSFTNLCATKLSIIAQIADVVVGIFNIFVLLLYHSF